MFPADYAERLSGKKYCLFPADGAERLISKKILFVSRRLRRNFAESAERLSGKKYCLLPAADSAERLSGKKYCLFPADYAERLSGKILFVSRRWRRNFAEYAEAYLRNLQSA
ncbi:MAG: hypothetical protein IPP51_07830 [Bacteroidetes bacterium]|nr:hypothetical protein [Bacteroidota bacterium]